MKNLLAPHDRPIPAEYRAAAVIASIIVITCFATATWIPWFIRDATTLVPGVTYRYLPVVVILGGAFGAVMVSAVWLAFRWPALAIAIALLPALVNVFDTELPVHFGLFATLAAVTLTSSWRRPRWAIAATVIAIAGVAIWVAGDGAMAAPFQSYIVAMEPGDFVDAGVVYTVVLLLVLGGGLLLRRNALRDEERRALMSRAGEVEEQAAVVGERARLARDLHDVVAHHVSLIAVRAETAPYTVPELPPTARTVLSDIAADARLALDELRGVLGILGRAEEGSRSPQPTWQDISALVERTRSAGVEISLDGDAAAEVAPSVGYAAYRVVQEALTNARKHAAGKPVSVVLDTTGQLVSVRVSTPFNGAEPGNGHGLVGMRERVEGLGGRLTAGPVGGRFVVEATLARSAA